MSHDNEQIPVSAYANFQVLYDKHLVPTQIDDGISLRELLSRTYFQDFDEDVVPTNPAFATTSFRCARTFILRLPTPADSSCGHRCSDKGFLPMSQMDYFLLPGTNSEC